MTDETLDPLNVNYEFILKSLRKIGYSLESAIADLIDNSLSANARNIWIDTKNGKYLMISDDGDGLDTDGILSAMNIGSMDCDATREKTDLGRFGMGLKLSSFSQCTKFTFASKTTNGSIDARQWDLDLVREHGFVVRRVNLSEYPKITEKLDSLDHGSVVFWENLDQHIKDANNPTTEELTAWGHKLDYAAKYLGMVFQRYIDDGVTITLPVGTKVQPWDPFLAKDIRVDKLSTVNAKGLIIQPYVLPSDLTQSEKEDDAGPMKSMYDAQGFYVYRGKRLISFGTWLKLRGCRKSRDSQFARIKIDIPNSADSLWGLDVKKTEVRCPPEYKEILKDAAFRARARSHEKYLSKYQGSRIKTDKTSIWEDKSSDKIKFGISRDYPVISGFRAGLNNEQSKQFTAILRLIEEQLPYGDIIHHQIEMPEIPPPPFDEDKEELAAILTIVEDLLCDNTLSPDEKREKLLHISPFSEKPEVINSLFTNIEK